MNRYTVTTLLGQEHNFRKSKTKFIGTTNALKLVTCVRALRVQCSYWSFRNKQQQQQQQQLGA